MRHRVEPSAIAADDDVDVPAADGGQDHSPLTQEPTSLRHRVLTRHRMKVLEAGLRSSAPRHLAEAAGCQWPAAPEPEGLIVSLRVAATDPKVPIEGLRGAVADPDEARSSPLRLGEQKRQLIEIHILDAESGDLRKLSPRVDEHPNNRCVPSVLEAGTVASLQQIAELIVTKNPGGDSRTFGGDMFRIGEAAISPSSTAKPKKCCNAR
jgi:hypothetical protein